MALTGLINIIHVLDALELVDALPAHLEAVKSLLAEHDQLRSIGGDALVTNIATSYIVDRDRDRVNHEQQIAIKTALSERASREIEHLKFDSEEQEEIYKMTLSSIHLSKEKIRRFEESLAQSLDELKRLQQDHDVVLAEEDRL